MQKLVDDEVHLLRRDFQHVRDPCVDVVLGVLGVESARNVGKRIECVV